MGRTNVVLLNGNAPIVQETSSYDSASRLFLVGDGGLNTATYSYLASSPLVSQITFKQSGTTTRMTTTKNYDFLNRLLSIPSSPSSSSAAPIVYSYLYNDANQRIKVTLADGSYWVYLYDNLGQVTSGKKYWQDGTPVAGQQFEYGFDDIGNRSSTKAGGDQNGSNLRSANYTPNNLNQYNNRTIPNAVDITGVAIASSSVTVNSQSPYRHVEYFRYELGVNNASAPVWQSVSVSASGQGNAQSGNVFLPKSPEQFGYDYDGNLTSDGRWSYTWDGENRLTSMQAISSVPSSAKLKLDFVYDYKGRRIQKTVSTWNGSSYGSPVVTKFVYDAWNLVASLNAQLSTLNSFLWGSDLTGSLQGAGGIGGLREISDLVNGVYFPAFDGNGNVAGLVKSADGTVCARYEYAPFGELVRATGPVARANPFRFSTKYQDDETDLLYYGYRYYSSAAGRWLSQDPVGEKENSNLYVFVMNEDLVHWDGLGLECCLITYPPGYYHGDSVAPPHHSRGGHSVLKCDEAYVSFYPEKGGNPSSQWHNEDQDTHEYANGPTPVRTCFGKCVNQEAVKQWLQQAQGGESSFCDHWTLLNNCGDATGAAIAAGLPQPQVKPKCPCGFKIRDIFDNRNALGITWPTLEAASLSQLVPNQCQRYKCVQIKDRLRSPHDL